MVGIAALALVSGVLIGCIGIGGVLLVPCLSLAGIDVHAAIGASLSIGVTFGCAVGARVAHAVPAAFLARVVAVALMLVGVVVAVRSGHTLARTW